MKKILSILAVMFTLLCSMLPVNAGEVSVGVEESELAEKGWLAAEAEVPENFVSDIYVSVADKNGNEYQLMLYSVNNYLDRKEVPVGEYVITGAGVMNDLTNKFPITYKNKSDTVTVAAKTSASLIQIKVDSSEKEEAATQVQTKQNNEDIVVSQKTTEEAIDRIEQVTTAPSQTTEMADKAGRQFISSIIVTLIVIVISIAGVIIYKKKRY